jgi:hypothetical protein
MYKNVYLDSLLVRQLNHRDFICNALNCLNEENKRSSNCLSLYNFLFIFSCFMFNWLNEENKRFTNYLSLFFFFILIIIVVTYYYLIIYNIYIYKNRITLKSALILRHVA